MILELGGKRVLGVDVKKQLMEGACKKKEEREEVYRNRSILYKQ